MKNPSDNNVVETLLLTFVHSAGPMHLPNPLPLLTLVVSGHIPLIEHPMIERMLSAGYGAISCLQADPPSSRTSVVTRGSALALRQSLLDLNLPLTSPDLHLVNDTSDWSASTLVSGSVAGESFAFSMSQMSSGYRGRHAPGFSSLVRQLLPMAGLDPDDQQWIHLLHRG